MLRWPDVNSGDEKQEDIFDDALSINGESKADKAARLNKTSIDKPDGTELITPRKSSSVMKPRKNAGMKSGNKSGTAGSGKEDMSPPHAIFSLNS